MQVGRDQHEGDVGFRSNDAERKQLGFLGRANFLDDLRERDLGSALFVGAEQLPLREINSVKQMETMPSFLRNERSVFVGHHASVRLPKLWSRERRKSLPPGSARVSRAGDDVSSSRTFLRPAGIVFLKRNKDRFGETRALPGALAAPLRRRFGLA